MSGRESMLFPRREWKEHGVTRREVGIPDETRRGVLAPNVLEALQRDAGLFAASPASGVKHGVPRDLPPTDLDLSGGSVQETELSAKSSQGEIPITRYRAPGGAENRPALIYLHGGGFRMGSRRSVEHSARLLARYSGFDVFSVEYRLAPENPFPCAADDAWAALRWTYRSAKCLNINRSRIFIAGDSAGGNLAAVCARRDRNMRTGMLRGQLLVYPVLSQREPAVPGYHFSLDDYEICAEQAQWIQAAVLSMKTTTNCLRLYTRTSEEDASPDASPLLDKSFAGLPPTRIFCAEFDYLTQQAKAYGSLLSAAGVSVELTVYRGMTHGFMNRLGQYPQAELLHRDMADALRQLI